MFILEIHVHYDKNKYELPFCLKMAWDG